MTILINYKEILCLNPNASCTMSCSINTTTTSLKRSNVCITTSVHIYCDACIGIHSR